MFNQTYIDAEVVLYNEVFILSGCFFSPENFKHYSVILYAFVLKMQIFEVTFFFFFPWLPWFSNEQHKDT